MPLAALVAVVLFALIALALGVGTMVSVQTANQRAVDATALAAAQLIQNGDSEAVATPNAQLVAQQDGVGSSELTVQYLNSSGVATTTASQVAYVKVSASQSVALPFGNAVKLLNTTSYVEAEAALGVSGPACGLCVLNPSAPDALEVTGSGTISVSAGAVAVDSSSSSALDEVGSASITAPSISIAGGYKFTGSASSTPTPQTGQGPVTNPLAGFVAPVLTTSRQLDPNVGGSSRLTINPGIYASITVGTSGQLTMNPGTYVVEGNFTIGGSGEVTGNGVTIYLTCSGYSSSDTEPCAGDGSSGGCFITGGSATFDLVAPSTGNDQGIVIASDPNNTASCNSTGGSAAYSCSNDDGGINISGSANDVLDGTLYAPQMQVVVTGSGGSTQLNSVFIVDQVCVTGSGSINLDSTAQSNAPSVYDNGLPELIK